MAIGVTGFLDMVTDSVLISFFIPLTIISIGGGLPFILENRRLKKLENGLPELLEGISTSLGAGLGLQQAITSMSEQRNDGLGELLRRAIARSKITIKRTPRSCGKVMSQKRSQVLAPSISAAS